MRKQFEANFKFKIAMCAPAIHPELFVNTRQKILLFFDERSVSVHVLNLLFLIGAPQRDSNPAPEFSARPKVTRPFRRFQSKGSR
jgi:hypothetical protein